MSWNNATDQVNQDFGRQKTTLTKTDGTTTVRWIPNIKPYNYQQPIPDDVIKSNSGAEYPQNYSY